MKNQRPVYLNLWQIKQFLPAIISILHRISGVFLFLYIPFVLWALNDSLASAAGFNAVQQLLGQPIIGLLTWLFMAALLFHLVAGIRHMIMDVGVGESLTAGRKGAYAVLGIAIVLIILVGIGL